MLNIRQHKISYYIKCSVHAERIMHENVNMSNDHVKHVFHNRSLPLIIKVSFPEGPSRIH